MTQYTLEDLEKARDKAAKALERLERIADDLNPNYSWDNFGTDPMTFAEELHMQHFTEAFRPSKYKVTVWIARPYFVEVEAQDEEDAINKVEENIHSYEHEFMPDHSMFVESLAVNVLSNNLPFQTVAEPVED